MRTPVLLESWWNRTDFGEVAEYSLIGTLTNPKLIAPDQIARGIAPLYSASRKSATAERGLAASATARSPAGTDGPRSPSHAATTHQSALSTPSFPLRCHSL